MMIKKWVQWFGWGLPGLLYDFMLATKRAHYLHHPYHITSRTILFFSLSVLLLALLEWIRHRTYPGNAHENFSMTDAVHIVWWFSFIPMVSSLWFWTRKDVIIRCKWTLALMFITYILWGWSKHVLILLHKLFGRRRRLELLIFFACIYIVSGVSPLFRHIEFSGDEPHYLIITQSLVEDHDLNVANNYLQMNYGLISPRKLDIHAWQGKGPGITLYSIHMPGLSFLLMPWYMLGTYYPPGFVTTIRIGMIFYTLLSLLFFYNLCNQLFSDKREVVYVLLCTGMTVPFFFFSSHIYPEIIVFGILTLAYSFYLKSEQRSFYFLFSTFLISTLPFFGVKYLIFPIIWLFFILYRLIKEYRTHLFAVTTGIAYIFPLAVFFAMIHEWYGTVNPFAIYGGGKFENRVWNTIRILFTDSQLWIDRLGTLLNFFLDQRDGLLFYSPLYFFGVLGWVHWYRRNPRRALEMGLFFLPYIGLYSFMTIRGGFCPPARPLLPVAWVMALGWVYWWNSKHRDWVRTVATLSIVYSLLMPWFMLTMPESIYQSTNHDTPIRASLTFERLSNLVLYLPDYLPSYTKAFHTFWLPNYIWGGIFLLTTLLYIGRLMQFRFEELIPPFPTRHLSPPVIIGAVSLGFIFLTGFFPHENMKKYFTFETHDLTMSYPKRNCKITDSNDALDIQCIGRPETHFIFRSRRPIDFQRIMVRCLSPTRPLDYDLYWFDTRPRPLIREHTWMLFKKRPWFRSPRYYFNYWGYLSLQSLTTPQPRCKDWKISMVFSQ